LPVKAAPAVPAPAPSRPPIKAPLPPRPDRQSALRHHPAANESGGAFAFAFGRRFIRGRADRVVTHSFNRYSQISRALEPSLALGSRDHPVTGAPARITVTPWTTTDWASTPLKLSPTLLFLALTVCCNRTTRGVPTGTVYAWAGAERGSSRGSCSGRSRRRRRRRSGGGGGGRGSSSLGGGCGLCSGGGRSRAFIASAQQQQSGQRERKHAGGGIRGLPCCAAASGVVCAQ